MEVPSAMATVENLQRELTCSIWLDYFKELVSIHCGHNFCPACISQCWEGSGRNVSCPQCRRTARRRNFRWTGELGNVTGIAKRLSFQAARSSGGCEQHQEVLKLFCEKDQTPICLVCRESKAPRAHAVAPIEEPKVHLAQYPVFRQWPMPGARSGGTSFIRRPSSSDTERMVGEEVAGW
uniref:Uncharacterized protein n=1 Tax=Chelydra serpentina TaxID=8475 RepID=A0A8C3SXQ3_CHESE